ncbi:MAG TPA: heme exporter protein CcmD [Stellaceae bacterium]|nr:heme exporter protein CcmD [Stellaceae bacterium]
MTAAIAKYLAMGGYARYVWPAYGVAVVVLGGLVLESIIAYRRRRAELARLERGRPLR